MEILSYRCKDLSEQGWDFSTVKFKKINLLVGNSSTGKTKFINTIFNLGQLLISKEINRTGYWEISTKINEAKYDLIVETMDANNIKIIKREFIKKTKADGNETILIDRNDEKYLFNGKELPKLPANAASIYLLKDENEMKPLFNGFGSILKRYFSHDLTARNDDYESIPLQYIKNEGKNIETVLANDFNTSIKMFILQENFNEIFKQIIVYFKEIFPFIKEVSIKNFSELHGQPPLLSGIIPVFCIKESNVEKWIEYKDLSSGIKKVLIILIDTFVLPDGGIYLLDEYENSLGLNAINFFPDFLLSQPTKKQFILTSHHPYIINKIPISDWYVFTRDGSKVSIIYGEDLIARFGKSKQQAFLKLINDKLFTDAIK